MTYEHDYDDDWEEQTECEGCGAGGPYRNCVCPADRPAAAPEEPAEDGWPLVDDYWPEQTEPVDS